MTIAQALKAALAHMEQAGVPDATHDARSMLANVLSVEPVQTLLMGSRELTDEQSAAFFRFVERRASREPLQYILGAAYFMGNAFLVKPGVLIPRADTEALCQAAIALTKPGDHVLDLCCGSGCLGISLKLACPQAVVYAGDLSSDAVEMTAENASRLNAVVDIRQGDLFAPFFGLAFDLIISNPPYIPANELPALQAEVRQEPALALDGGEDGLLFYRRILTDALPRLKPGGYLLLELGDRQAGAVSALVSPPYLPPRVEKDLSGLPRVLITRKAPS